MLISGMGLLLAIISLMCSVWTAGYKAGAQWQRKHKKDDFKQDRPFIVPKEKRGTIKIDWKK